MPAIYCMSMLSGVGMLISTEYAPSVYYNKREAVKETVSGKVISLGKDCPCDAKTVETPIDLRRKKTQVSTSITRDAAKQTLFRLSSR